MRFNHCLQMTIKVKDITAMKKEKTAHLFPNAIVISTAEKRVRPC